MPLGENKNVPQWQKRLSRVKDDHRRKQTTASTWTKPGLEAEACSSGQVKKGGGEGDFFFSFFKIFYRSKLKLEEQTEFKQEQ